MMKRALSALLSLCLAVGLLAGAVRADFTDIGDRETALAAAVLEGLGIVRGSGDGIYDPAGDLTRAEFCTMAVRLLGMEDQVSAHAGKTLFSDVKAGQWYTGYVNLAYAQGIVNGYGNGLFGPNDPLTDGQLVTVALRLLGYASGDVGTRWPADYVTYAGRIGLSDGVAVTGADPISRGDTALLLYNLLELSKKNGSSPYYKSIPGVASTAQAILLTGGSQPEAALLEGTAVTLATYEAARPMPTALAGTMGTLLLDSDGAATGFLPGDYDTLDLTVASAAKSRLTDADGGSRKIPEDASVIIGGQLYQYGSTGYLQVQAAAGSPARLWLDDSGAVTCIWLSGGLSADGAAAVAQTHTAASELARTLGVSGSYSITKNGAAATAADLARYDVAWYDKASNTLRASDWQITGLIEALSPDAQEPETVTVAGNSLQVLECAWDSLENFAVGQQVTLLLTDECKVAAAVAPFSAAYREMVGLLDTAGSAVTLYDSGLKVQADTVTADESLWGGLVRVVTSGTSLHCYSLEEGSGKLDLTARTLSGTALAPDCAVFEWAGSGYIYSLEGVQGTASRDFSAITWTTVLNSAYVSRYTLNSAGQVDTLLLRDVTGNFYTYGKLTRQKGAITQSSGGLKAENDALTVANSSGAGSRYLCSVSTPDEYAGIALRQGTISGYKAVTAVAKLQAVTVTAADLLLSGEDWYARIDGYEIPVSDAVEVWLDSTGRWSSGQEGLLTALQSGLELTACYDRTLTTGAQVRILTAK